jgi:hypothetical protein
MKSKAHVVLLTVLTVTNLVILTIQTAPIVKASVAGMGYYELRRDRDFRRAVEDVVEDCSVRGNSISC